MNDFLKTSQNKPLQCIINLRRHNRNSYITENILAYWQQWRSRDHQNAKKRRKRSLTIIKNCQRRNKSTAILTDHK
jgi:hypothetical protein